VQVWNGCVAKEKRTTTLLILTTLGITQI